MRQSRFGKTDDATSPAMSWNRVQRGRWRHDDGSAEHLRPLSRATRILRFKIFRCVSGSQSGKK
jgi:hypothetical protein